MAVGQLRKPGLHTASQPPGYHLLCYPGSFTPTRLHDTFPQGGVGGCGVHLLPLHMHQLNFIRHSSRPTWWEEDLPHFPLVTSTNQAAHACSKSSFTKAIGRTCTQSPTSTTQDMDCQPRYLGKLPWMTRPSNLSFLPDLILSYCCISCQKFYK